MALATPGDVLRVTFRRLKNRHWKAEMGKRAVPAGRINPAADVV